MGDDNVVKKFLKTVKPQKEGTPKPLKIETPSKEDLLGKAKEMGSKGFDLAGRIMQRTATTTVATVVSINTFSECTSCHAQYDLGDKVLRQGGRLTCPQCGGNLIVVE